MKPRNWLQSVPTQEAYHIDRILFDVQHDPEKEARFFADPSAYIADAPLSGAARAALEGTDIGRLYLLGANPYLLRAYCLQLRIPETEYLQALRAVEGETLHG
jgi:protocatechuate 4,5-dioxygenase alpha chain